MTENKGTILSGILVILSIIVILLGITTYSFFFQSYFLLTNPDLHAWIPALESSAFFIMLEMLFFFLFRNTTSISFSEFLKKDCVTFIPSFFLLLSLTDFLSASHIPEDKILKVMLGYVFTIIIFLKAFLYFNYSFESLIEKTEGQLKKILFFAFFFFFAFLSLWTLTALGPTGDEPMYLLETNSLAKDHDFNISNNLFYEDYKAYYNGHLSPEGYDPAKPYYYGVRFIGLPILILPGFILAGKYGAGLTIAFMASLFAVNIFLLIEEFLGDRKYALLVTIAAASAMPLIFFSSRIYPDVPASLLLLYAFRKITRDEAKPADMIFAGLAVALMPWFHQKFVVSAGVISIIAIALNRKSPRKIPAFLLLPLLSSAAYILFFKHFYSPATELSSSAFTWNIYTYILALFFDGEGGLFWFSPFFMLSLAGAYFYVKNKEKHWLAAISLILPILAFLGGFKGFQGGYGLARHLIPLIPYLALFAAEYLVNSKNAKTYWIFAMPNFILSLFLTGLPWLIFNDRNGKNIFLEFIDKFFKTNISGILPTFEIITVKTYLLSFLYGAAFILISILLIKRQNNAKKA